MGIMHPWMGLAYWIAILTVTVIVVVAVWRR